MAKLERHDEAWRPAGGKGEEAQRLVQVGMTAEEKTYGEIREVIHRGGGAQAIGAR